MKRRSHFMRALCHGAVVGTMSARELLHPLQQRCAMRRYFLASEEEAGVSPSLVREWVRRPSLLHPREFGAAVGGRRGFLYEARALQFAEG